MSLSDIQNRNYLPMPKPASITHQHILSALLTLYKKQSYNSKEVIRILDAGCGDGRLIAFLLSSLVLIFNSDPKIEIFGFDVFDHGVQKEGFIFNTIKTLSDVFPEIPWDGRIRYVGVDDEWPFDDGFFNFIVSNQVLEHVHNKYHFFSNISRTLKNGGYSVNLAPLMHCIWEGHVHLPLAHKIRNHTALLIYIYICSVLGLGNFSSHHKKTGISRRVFSGQQTNYVLRWTSYTSESETLKLSRDCGLKCDFSYSLEFYTQKLRSILGLPFSMYYRNRRFGITDAVLIKILRYISSVTLICHKRNTY